MAKYEPAPSPVSGTVTLFRVGAASATMSGENRHFHAVRARAREGDNL
jgi:hypothetical protein